MNDQRITVDQLMKLPDFLRLELIDGKIITDDYTTLIIDEDVFDAGEPSWDNRITYRLSIVKD